MEYGTECWAVCSVWWSTGVLGGCRTGKGEKSKTDDESRFSFFFFIAF